MMAGMRADAPAAFHLPAKPTGAICNLDCSYCCFLSKEMLYAGSRLRMAGAGHRRSTRPTRDRWAPPAGHA